MSTKEHKSCSLDSHGLACKASSLADQAVETAYAAGMLTIHRAWLEEIMPLMDSQAVLEVESRIYENYIGKEYDK